LRKLLKQLNSTRKARLAEELAVLSNLPSQRLESCKRLKVKVRGSSTIRVQHNVYSLCSQLIGEAVEARLYAERIEVWYAQRCVEVLPRLRGEGKHHIQYRHIIDTLVRKPGAFANYCYQSDLFPTHRFRMAYDDLKRRRPGSADREYVQILALAARESEAAVDLALNHCIDTCSPITLEQVKAYLAESSQPARAGDVEINTVDLTVYDVLAGVEVSG
jgi:hypothetical protein